MQGVERKKRRVVSSTHASYNPPKQQVSVYHANHRRPGFADNEGGGLAGQVLGGRFLKKRARLGSGEREERMSSDPEITLRWAETCYAQSGGDLAVLLLCW